MVLEVKQTKLKASNICIMRSFFIAIAFLFSVFLKAQDPEVDKVSKHQISFGVPVASTNQILYLVDVVLDDVFESAIGEGTYTESINILPIMLSYRYKYNRLYWGGDVSFERIETTYTNDDNATKKRGRSDFLTVALKADFHYVEKKHFQMYSGLGVAFTSRNDDYEDYESSTTFSGLTLDEMYPNVQVTALGFRFGNKVAGILEIGAGYAGIVNLGISARF